MSLDNLKGRVTRYVVCTAYTDNPPVLKTYYLDVTRIFGFSISAGGVVTIHTEAVNNFPTPSRTGLVVEETLYQLMDSIVQKLPT